MGIRAAFAAPFLDADDLGFNITTAFFRSIGVIMRKKVLKSGSNCLITIVDM
jgi:hypothetical protein